jgi:hypothetical protein
MEDVMNQAKAVLDIKSSEERPFAPVTNAPKLARYNAIISYEGDMVGEGVLQELKTYIKPNFAMIYGLERFKGRLGGKEGSFIFQRSGKCEKGKFTLRWDVIPYSATGELRGLIGRVDFESDPAERFPIIFNYEIQGPV